jgi:ABC-type nickel/cobalt efflux system permease component RcnA
MFAAFLGGWEVLIILGVVMMMGIGLLVGVGAIAVLLWRQQKKSAPSLSTQQQVGH